MVQINQNANRAAALVSQLLAFSRKQTLRPEPIDMRNTLADLMHLLNRLVGEKVELNLEHDTDLKPVRADKHLHRECVMQCPTGGALISKPYAADRDKSP